MQTAKFTLADYWASLFPAIKDGSRFMVCPPNRDINSIAVCFTKLIYVFEEHLQPLQVCATMARFAEAMALALWKYEAGKFLGSELSKMHLLSKISMFCALSQNNQNLFEK